MSFLLVLYIVNLYLDRILDSTDQSLICRYHILYYRADLDHICEYARVKVYYMPKYHPILLYHATYYAPPADCVSPLIIGILV
jgi:hypothetical protein